MSPLLVTVISIGFDPAILSGIDEVFDGIDNNQNQLIDDVYGYNFIDSSNSFSVSNDLKTEETTNWLVNIEKNYGSRVWFKGFEADFRSYAKALIFEENSDLILVDLDFEKCFDSLPKENCETFIDVFFSRLATKIKDGKKVVCKIQSTQTLCPGVNVLDPDGIYSPSIVASILRMNSEQYLNWVRRYSEFDVPAPNQRLFAKKVF